ncbi:unnamed protein product [Choristocarpus tenellus]
MVKRLSQLCKGMGITCTMEDDSPFTVHRNLRMDLVFHAGALVDDGSAPYQDKGLLLDVAFAEVQAISHLPQSPTSSVVYLLLQLRRESAPTTRALLTLVVIPSTPS